MICRTMRPQQQQVMMDMSSMDPLWQSALQPELSKPYFINHSNFITEQRRQNTVYPHPDNVFSWTQPCGPNDVKVVIIGQDPYHGAGQADGLAFSVLPGNPIPPSLYNIFTELENSIVGFQRPNHGNLMGWAQQGVLMLNTILTVTEGLPNSHQQSGWVDFTNAVISYLNNNVSGLVFMLWGKYAQEKAGLIDMLTADDEIDSFCHDHEVQIDISITEGNCTGGNEALPSSYETVTRGHGYEPRVHDRNYFSCTSDRHIL